MTRISETHIATNGFKKFYTHTHTHTHTHTQLI